MSVIPVDPKQFSEFIDNSKIFDMTRRLMRDYLTNWYSDDAEMFMEDVGQGLMFHSDGKYLYL